MFIDHHTHSIKNLEISGENDVLHLYSIDLSNQYPDYSVCQKGALYTAGFHPHGVHGIAPARIEQELRGKIPFILGIGECGIDMLAQADIETQKQAFLRHVDIAEEYGLPLIIHCVRAYQHIAAMHKSIRPHMPWILHGFNRHPELARQLGEQGFLFSIGGKALMQEKGHVPRLCGYLEAGTFFLESDMSAIPIQDLYSRAAALRDCTVQELQQIIQQTFIRVYGESAFSTAGKHGSGTPLE
jgi:TatD DNase family protein